MKKDSVLNLKRDVLRSLQPQVPRERGARMEGLAHPQPEQRLGVGYSHLGKGAYRLELRVQRKNGAAYRLAEKIRQEARNEANIEEVPKIAIPPAADAASSHEVGLVQMKRPLHIGLSIAHTDGDAGTLGAFVSDDSGNKGILSNNHVLALTGRAHLNDRICQPGGTDGAGVAAEEIASLANYIIIGKTRRDSSDAAFAILDKGIQCESNIIPTGYGFAFEGQVIKEVKSLDAVLAKLKKGTVVCKVGRTTGLTTGRISAVALDNIPVDIAPDATMIFNNLIEISWESAAKPFSRPGDSGSMVFTREGFFAIGLHFAGGQKKMGRRTIGVSYSCNMASVLRTLRISLLD
jgi:hypothetical protein